MIRSQIIQGKFDEIVLGDDVHCLGEEDWNRHVWAMNPMGPDLSTSLVTLALHHSNVPLCFVQRLVDHCVRINPEWQPPRSTYIEFATRCQNAIRYGLDDVLELLNILARHGTTHFFNGDSQLPHWVYYNKPILCLLETIPRHVRYSVERCVLLLETIQTIMNNARVQKGERPFSWNDPVLVRDYFPCTSYITSEHETTPLTYIYWCRIKAAIANHDALHQLVTPSYTSSSLNFMKFMAVMLQRGHVLGTLPSYIKKEVCRPSEIVDVIVPYHYDLAYQVYIPAAIIRLCDLLNGIPSWLEDPDYSVEGLSDKVLYELIAHKRSIQANIGFRKCARNIQAIEEMLALIHLHEQRNVPKDIFKHVRSFLCYKKE